MNKRTNVLHKRVYIVECKVSDGDNGEYTESPVTGNRLIKIDIDDPPFEKVVTLIHELVHYVVAEYRRLFNNFNAPDWSKLEEDLAERTSQIFVNSVVKLDWVETGIRELKEGGKNARKR